jgi:N-acetylmuramoyl-L-alanine amidase CwlA
MTIHKLLTKVNYDKYGSTSRIKYIVVHYVGASGGAEENCRYFHTKYRDASAHYFVGHKGEIWQCVQDKDIAWHCGRAGKVSDKKPNNQNSIGIEMCCYKEKGTWKFYDATVESTILLVKDLMKKYNVPVENVIRHYDVTGKNCPRPYVLNNTKHTWTEFKKALTTTATANKEIYRVRKNWNDEKTQKAAFEIFENAKKYVDKHDGYFVFDSSGKQLYPVAEEKNIEDIAKEVIAGKWDNGAARKKKLIAAGYDYDAVQAMVNKLMK